MVSVVLPGGLSGPPQWDPSLDQVLLNRTLASSNARKAKKKIMNAGFAELQGAKHSPCPASKFEFVFNGLPLSELKKMVFWEIAEGKE